MALGQLATPKTAAYLEPLREDKDPRVRAAVLSTLRAMKRTTGGVK